jgi:pantetheine-phosphate adenylyltransferase
MKAIYPGSFDPITLGHLDIIYRAAELFDSVVIVVMQNADKQGLFTKQERVAMIEESVRGLNNVTVAIGEGLTVDFARKLNAKVLVRGIRAVTDYEYEMQMATANMTLAPELTTVFLVAKPEYSFLSSSIAKDIAKNGGALDDFVPPCVEEKLTEKFRPER